MTDVAYGDPLTRPFWEAARQRKFLLQHCHLCDRYQHYPRPYCLICQQDVMWAEAAGTGLIYAQTTVRLPVSPLLDPPYVVALVDLAEGPRITAYVLGEPTRVGDAVRITWLDRDDAPPLPAVELA